MKKDLQTILDLYRDKELTWWQVFRYGLLMVIGLPIAMMWRAIIGILITLCGLCKIFQHKPRVKRIDQHKYDKCPCCGKELTFYNHDTYSDGICYTFCECGYDSREDKMDEKSIM